MHQPLSPPLEAFIAALPKVELHLHLEGSIVPATLLRIAARNHVELPARDETGVAQLLNYKNFHEFLTVFMVLARSLMHGEDFELLAYELGHHLADQRVRYAEVRNRRHSLVAWSIGGDEVNYPPELFAEVFAAARQAGLHLMAHAGEVVGPPSVWGAVDALGCERLGHGIRSVDDEALLAHLRARGVVLDVSPSSNLRTGAVPDIAAHPLRRLYDAGVHITLNTDDPTFFNTTLNDEYRLAARGFGFDAAELADLALGGVRAAFLPEDEKVELLREFEREIAELQERMG